jgi:hypothetical protein
MTDGKQLTYWLLPGQQVPGVERAEVQEWLARLNEQYPPSTPLDEL